MLVFALSGLGYAQSDVDLDGFSFACEKDSDCPGGWLRAT